MFDRPGVYRAATALACVIALVGGYAGASLLLTRSTSPSVEASEPSGAPATPAPQPEESGPIVVHGTGDVLLDPRELWILSSSFNAPWTGVRDLFGADDLTVVNLECAGSDLGRPEKKEFTFRCPNGFAAMHSSGVDVANLGNNHAGDYGKEALLDARARLQGAGVAPVGAGKDAAEANAPVIVERKGKRIAILGFGGVVPTPSWIATADTPGVADGYDTASMVEAVRSAAQHADFVVVTIHWGAELKTQPNADDVARAHALIDAGADAIFGHHAHVLQPLDWYKDRPIFYSLGNFVWPKGGPTAVGEVIFSPDGKVSACLLLGTITGAHPVLDDPGKRCDIQQDGGDTT